METNNASSSSRHEGTGRIVCRVCAPAPHPPHRGVAGRRMRREIAATRLGHQPFGGFATPDGTSCPPTRLRTARGTARFIRITPAGNGLLAAGGHRVSGVRKRRSRGTSGSDQKNSAGLGSAVNFFCLIASRLEQGCFSAMVGQRNQRGRIQPPSGQAGDRQAWVACRIGEKNMIRSRSFLFRRGQRQPERRRVGDYPPALWTSMLSRAS